MVVAGDFNSDMLLPGGNGKKLKSVIRFTGFSHIIKRPTRVSATSKTLIDLILVNNDSKVVASGVVHYSIADDKFTCAVYDLNSRNTPPTIKHAKQYQ